MKRHLIRVVILGTVVGLGWYAIAQTMGSASTTQPTDKTADGKQTEKQQAANNQAAPKDATDNVDQLNRVQSVNHTNATAPKTNLVGENHNQEIPNNNSRYVDTDTNHHLQGELNSSRRVESDPNLNRSYKNPAEVSNDNQLNQPNLQPKVAADNEVVLQPGAEVQVTANDSKVNDARVNEPTVNNRSAANLDLTPNAVVVNNNVQPVQNDPQLTSPPQENNVPTEGGTRYENNRYENSAPQNNPQPTPAVSDNYTPNNNVPSYAQPTAAENTVRNTPPAKSATENYNPTFNSNRNNAAGASFTGTTVAAVAAQTTPGDKKLEGVQAPSLTLEKTAPKEIQVGRAALFEIEVRNTGKVDAHNVKVNDAVPKGTSLISTTPQAQAGADGSIVWSLGTLKAGETKRLKMELMPKAEGEIGSVASVSFGTKASVRTVATRPRLTMEVTAPKKVMIGQNVDLKIVITNPGSGIASSVTIEENVPKGLQHVGGKEIEYEVGDLKPGEKREVTLSMKAVAAGQVLNTLLARAEGNLKVEKASQIEVVAPGLKVAINGPKLRYLERKAIYKLSIQNPGTASAKEVELVTYLPKSMKFVEASNSGEYDKTKHAVYWSLEELPATKSGEVTLTTIPTQAGNLSLKVEGKTEKGLTDTQVKDVVVEGLVALSFEVLDVQDPVELGGEVVYEVRVINRGTKTASNIKVEAVMPPELKAVSGKGPTAVTATNARITFAPLARLAPKADTTFTVRARAEKSGDLRINVNVNCDEMPRPVTRQESTRVFTSQ